MIFRRKETEMNTVQLVAIIIGVILIGVLILRRRARAR